MPLTGSQNDDTTLVGIEVNRIVDAVNATPITMPGLVIKKKGEFTVRIEAIWHGKGGHIIITLTPNRGWRLTQRITTRHISIKYKNQLSLKHRVSFSLQGKAKLTGIGIGDYVIYMS